MISELFRKIFGLDPISCSTCEVLRTQLEESNRERKQLLTLLLEKDKPEPPSTVDVKEFQPLKSQFVPWRVRQQMLEEADREKARLMKQKTVEINELEKELGVSNAPE